MRSWCAAWIVIASAACEATAPSLPGDVSGSSEADTSTAHATTDGSDRTTGSGDGNDVAMSGSGDGSGDETTGSDETPRNLLYIRSAPYPRLVIEVDHVEGRAPYPVAIDGIEQVFGEILDKPSGVEVVLDDVLAASPDADHPWSADAMQSLAEATFDLEVPDDTVKIHVLVLDGHAAGEGSTIFGLAWDQLNVVLFRDLYDAACADALLGPLQQPLCEQTELLIWQHEIGHVLGLVDAGLPMVADHRDPNGSLHDADPNCLMFADYEGTDAVLALVDQLVGSAPPIEFDQACLDDIEAAK